MSNVNTGFWSALGAVVGGAAGAVGGHYAAQFRPRHRFARAGRGDELEDAMVTGGAIGAVAGAFVFGALAGEDNPPAPPQLRTTVRTG